MSIVPCFQFGTAINQIVNQENSSWHSRNWNNNSESGLFQLQSG